MSTGSSRSTAPLLSVSALIPSLCSRSRSTKAPYRYLSPSIIIVYWGEHCRHDDTRQESLLSRRSRLAHSGAAGRVALLPFRGLREISSRTRPRSSTGYFNSGSSQNKSTAGTSTANHLPGPETDTANGLPTEEIPPATSTREGYCSMLKTFLNATNTLLESNMVWKAKLQYIEKESVRV